MVISGLEERFVVICGRKDQEAFCVLRGPGTWLRGQFELGQGRVLWSVEDKECGAVVI